jgi:hypothetical protein
MSMDGRDKSDSKSTGKLSQAMLEQNGIYLLPLGLKTFKLLLSFRTYDT